ncbi:hypothetical protein RP20_CCG020247 [Aedes albopictus]|nr:hypothetical protein RP20_CCG020247 [Aedes albopictus]
MARRIKLGQLLDIAFEIPETGVVNIRLLFEILRALLKKLGLNDLDVLVDLGQAGDTHGLADKSKCWEGFGPDELMSPSLMALDPEARAAEIARRRAEEIQQVLHLLKAYMVRLQALEAGLADLRAKRAEDLETMAKMLHQIDLLDARLCDQEKKVTKLEADMDCLGLAMMDYDIKIEDIFRRLDLMGVEIREARCQIRCIEKDRQQFLTAVQTVTEQINHFSLTKADKDVMEKELGLRALVEDLKRYVSYECYNLTQLELSSNIAKLYEEIYRQEQNLKSKAYELVKGLQNKADAGDMVDLRRQQSKILNKFRLMEMNSRSKNSTAAGISLNAKQSKHCLTCGLEASLEGFSELIPRPVQFVPPSKTKDIFTLRSRYCGGDSTIVKPEEKVVAHTTVLGLECNDKSAPIPRQIIGNDGSLYLADPCLELGSKS